MMEQIFPLVQTDITGSDSHDFFAQKCMFPKGKSPPEFGSPLCFSRSKCHAADIRCSESHILTTCGWIAMKRAPDIYVPLRMNPADFGDLMTFHLVPSSYDVTVKVDAMQWNIW